METIQKKQKLEETRYKVSEQKELEREEYNRKLKEQLLKEEDSDDDQDNQNQNQNKSKQTANNQVQHQPRTDCPYVSTIKRNLIDFDFEKLCSVTLNNLNVYACLVCSKYFGGRGKGTHAYVHSLDAGHHIFINLHNTKVYCLPENYEVEDFSLRDIKYNLKPEYTQKLIEDLNNSTQQSRALNGTKYFPGHIGLNNLKCTDYINVMIQALVRCKDFRDYFLLFDTSSVGLFDYKTMLVKRFAELVKKIWNPQNFKGHVSPHELIQAISLKSEKKFQIGTQSDAIHLFSWLFTNMQKEFRLVPKAKNILKQCFEGQVEVHTYKPLGGQVGYEAVPDIKDQNFMYLTLDVPAVPLYKQEQQSVPNVPIYQLLKKFDGITSHDTPQARRTYKIKELPKYLIIHMKRFQNNNFFMEKNPTIITFPLTNLDFSHYMSVQGGRKQEAKYDLLANISHEGEPKKGIFKIHYKHSATNQWFEVQDLHIQNIIPQLVCVSESYLQIWERKN